MLQLFYQLGTIRVSQFSQLLCLRQNYFPHRHRTGGLGSHIAPRTVVMAFPEEDMPSSITWRSLPLKPASS